MRIVKGQIAIKELKEMASKMFGGLVKAVVDIDKRIMAIDAELHSDEEALLVKNGSKQENLWGINIYPEMDGDDFIEFDSMINLRPRQNNKTRGVDDEKIKEKIVEIVNKLIKNDLSA